MSNANISLGNPGTLLAALPAVLGFEPVRSLVVVTLEQNRLGAVLRTDLAPSPLDHVGNIAAAAASSGADTAILVFVDEAGLWCPMCQADYRQLGDALSAALAERQVETAARYGVDALAENGSWVCIGGAGEGTRGAVDDPGASPMAAAAVLDGRRLYHRREELMGIIAVADPDRTAALKPIIEHCARQREDDTASSDRPGEGRIVDALTATSWVMQDAELSDGQVAALACSLTDGTVRDALYALAVGPAAGRVEDTFAWLSRTLPEPWRADALTFTAFFAYARGDGPLAGVALDAALTVTPSHRMARLLNSALQSGMHPNRIRELAESRPTGPSAGAR